MPMLGDFPYCSPYFLLRMGFSLKLELISLARLAGHWVPRIFLSQPPHAHHHIWPFFLWALRTDLEPSVRLARQAHS